MKTLCEVAAGSVFAVVSAGGGVVVGTVDLAVTAGGFVVG